MVNSGWHIVKLISDLRLLISGLCAIFFARGICAVLFLGLCSMLLAPCLPAEAQQAPKGTQIGFLIVGTPTAIVDRLEAFRQGLNELGYLEGKNIVIELRWAEGKSRENARACGRTNAS